MAPTDARLNKRRVLFVLLPEHGAFNASFMLARKLSARGCHVVYIGHQRFQDHVSRQGFDYVVIKDRPHSSSFTENRDRGHLWRSKRLEYRHAYQWYSDALHFIAQWLDTNRPSLALLDPLLWQFAPPLLEYRVPILSLNTTLASAFDTHSPPVFSDIIPRNGISPFSRLRNLAAWIRTLSKAYVRHLVNDLRLIWVFGPVRYHNYRPGSLVKKNLGTLRWGEYGQRLAAPELVMCPRELDFPRASSALRSYAGTCVDPYRQDDGFDWGCIQKDRPLVYCSLGTYSHAYPDARSLFSAVIAVLKRDNIQGIVQVGDSIDPQGFGLLPPHIRVARRVAQLEVLQCSATFITHGGLSSVREAIYFGVPMIVFPCWLDQQGNAARVVYYHLGLRADISKVDEKGIRMLLARIRHESFRVSMQRMQAIFRRQEHCVEAIETMARFLR